MVFLIEQQAPEPPWNTIPRINSDGPVKSSKSSTLPPVKNQSAQLGGGEELLSLFWWNFPSFGKLYFVRYVFCK